MEPPTNLPTTNLPTANLPPTNLPTTNLPTTNLPTTITVTLIWRSEAETSISYRVFLHLIGPEGKLVAQSDGVPAAWSRPTTGWLPGEIVIDERVLTIPAEAEAGKYVLQAGMYTLEGGRLSTPQGKDTVIVTTILVRDQ